MGGKPTKVASLDPNVKDGFGHTALDRAVFNNDLFAVTLQLETPGIDVNVPSRGYVPLHRCVPTALAVSCAPLPCP